MKKEAVEVPVKVLEGLDHVRESGKTNMLDRPAVQYYAYHAGYHETVDWLEWYPSEYSRGIFDGFVTREEAKEGS